MNNYPEVFHMKNNNNSCTHTTYAAPIQNLQNVIQDNKVESILTDETWSNQRSYGNLVYGKMNEQNIQTMVRPYNRLEPLKSPYFTNVDTDLAWKSN